MFHVRRRPADYHPRKRKKKPQQKWNHQSSTEMHEYRYEDGFDRLPFFLELNPDGSDIAGGTAKRHRLHPNVTEVGSERASPHSQSQSLQLFGPNVQPRHCVIAHTEGIVTVTPCSRDAETYVNGQRIYETTILQNGSIVKFGRIHNFRFCDPCHDERIRQRHDSARTAHDYSYDRQSTGSQPPVTPTPTQNYETTFDVDGNIETRSTSSLGNKEETRSQRSVGSSSRDGNRLSNYERYPRGNDPILPAVLELREEKEEALLHALITDLEPSVLAFKLAPAYTLYLAARYRASTHYRPELTPTERAYRLTLMLAKVAAMIHNVIQERYCEVKSLALWLANASELLHFLKSDRHVSAFSLDAQDTLADAVQIAFRHLVACLQGELAAVMPNFLSEREDLSHDPEDSSTASVLGVLASAMALLRRCRVNAALTIQLFSQLFHFVNVWSFNRIVAPNSQYCSRAWGLRLKARLAQVEVWAERQGLELAADCHLARIMQAAHLLQAPKYSAEDLATLSSTCFKLNSLQLRALLQKYQPTPDEPRLPHELIDNVVRAAENLADELARSDGREVKLEEEPELALPFLLPEDGYSCEVVRGIPPGLVEFVGPLQHAGLCRLSAQPTSNGLWTVYMGPANPMVRSPSAMSNRSGGFVPTQQQPEVQIIKLHKSNNGMGLSIVAAKGAGQDRLGIYIKSVVKGGAADADGRLQAGDQLLKVDGQSLVGITQEKAAEYLVRTGPVVTLEVAKQGAIYHGLATLLSQPSPVMARASHKTVSLSSLAEEPACVSPSDPPPSHNQSCQTLSAEHFENNIPEIRIEFPSTTSAAENLLMVPGARVKCYKIPPDNDLCLCEDIFQQHQAKLVNCDSEDADAISRNREVDSQSKDDSNSIKSNQFNNPKADVVRYQRKDQGTDVMSPKWQYRSLDNISDVSKEDRFAGWVPLPGMRKCKSDFYLSRDGEWKMVNGKDDLKDAFSEEIRVYNLSERQTECYKEILEAVVSSTSTSECGCDNDSVSPKSTDSSSISSGTLTLKPTSNKGNCEINSNNQNKTLTSKLSAEERDKALKELDEIVSGSFLKKISDFGQGVTYSGSTRDKMSEFLSDMLKLDLSSLKNSSSDNSDPKSNPSSEDEMLQFGCGRVAALAKHFSRMGEAGIIRGRGGNYNRAGRGRGLSRNSFRSEPNIAELSKDWLLNPHPDDIIIPAPLTENDKNSSHFQMIFTSFGLHPVGFSMDRLLDIGTQGVVLKEINSGKAEEVINEQEIDSKNETKHTIEDIILEGNYNDPEIENFITNPRARGMRFNSWTQTSDSIDLTNEPEQKENCAYQKALENFEKKVQKNSLTNFKKKSLSLDNCTNNISKSKPIDLKKKSISVDEIELRKMRKPPLQKHYSFVDLGSIDNDNQELLEDDKVGVMSSIGCKRLNGFRERRGKFCSSEEINKQYGMKDDISKDMSIRKWLSVDEAAQMSELSFKAEKLDTGTIKDSLRKIHKSGEGMGRKLKRMKKIDQKVFVVSPLRHSEMSPGDGVVSVFTSDDDCSPVWSARRNSVPASLLHNEMQEPFRPRRMSERDLPSRVLSEQQNLVPRGQLPPHAPQIHSSKSVPSLHSGNHELHGGGGVVVGGGVVGRSHEVFNPGYSRTSSTNSIPQRTFDGQPPPNTLRSRSSQNLTDHRGSNLPPNGGGNLGGRQASNPSLAQTQPPHPHTAYQQHVHQQQQQLLLQQQQQHQQQQQQHHQQQQQQQQQQHHQQQHQQHQQQNSPSGENGERFYQNLSIYRNQEIQNGFIPQGSGRGKLPSPQDDRSPAQLQKSFRGSQSSLSTGRPPDQSLSRPASAYLPQQATGHHPPHLQQNMAPRSQSSRDMLRQEAKLQEMSEEVRRRELRLTSPQSRLQMPQGPIQGPRPGYPVEPYSNGPGYPHSPRSLKQQESPGGYRESPPPPPPPTSTHPLYQPAPPPPMYQPARYAASMGEPPRGGYYPANNTQPPRPYQFQGTNPWEREEREKEMLMRKEAARQWRDQQIAELTALGANRNQQQEEQLRALRLEKEFERRAEEEAEEEEEEDTESNERVQGLLRVARQQDEKRHAAQTTPSPAPAPAPAPTRPPQQQVNGIIGRTTMPPSNNYPANPVIEEKERLRRLKEMKMKQAEMEAEARLKRRDEELRQQQINNSANLQQQVTPLSSHPRPSPARSNNTPPSHLRLDNLIVNQPAAPGQYNGYSPGQSSPAGAPPQPPERGSSFAVMSQTQGRSPNTPNNNSVGAKRVSFQDASPPSPPTNAAPPLDNIREDPNNFINDAETMLASPTSPDTPFTGNTPGVIGAQEVYKDPRTRRLQEQQNQKMMTAKVPEKLSFKEKMKMFAMETGEDGTPRDKVKISRAQRDIDNIGSPTTPNNNTSVSNNN